MKKLYFVVEKQTQEVGDDVHELTGWKTITVYEITDNQPKIFCSFEALNKDDSVEEIQVYLDNNGNEDEYEFDQL